MNDNNGLNSKTVLSIADRSVNFLPFREIFALTLISATITFLFQQLYIKIFPWVQSWNVQYPPGTLTPWIAAWNAERDGIEIYVLYSGMFLIGATVLVIFGGIRALQNKWLNWALMVSAFFFSLKFFSSIYFTPPSAPLIQDGLKVLLYCSLFGLFLHGLLHYQKLISKKSETLLVFLVLLPVCFMATSPIAATNYAYIFSPAQKLLDGFELTQIYFQYDLLLSMIAALWMKLNFNLSMFQILGQLSYLLTILGIFMIAQSLFRQRALSLLLLVALILVRYLSSPWDPVYVFQITPLRLDLWLIPFLIIYFRGPYHWLLPMVIGFLMLVHGNFGVIYAVGYIQLIASLEVLSLLGLGYKYKIARWQTPSFLFKALLTLVYLLACYLISRSIFSSSFEATSLYQKIGIGFIPLANNSFFWGYPIVTSSAFVLLYMLRGMVTPKYLALGFALLYFTLGNCIYFFGRSHEMNLFSIAIPLIFLLFYTLDLVDRWMCHKDNTHTLPVIRNLAFVLAFFFILVAAYSCADRIKINLAIIYKNALALQAHPGDPFAETSNETTGVIQEIRQVIGNSGRIHFMISDESKEFLFYQIERGNDAFFYPFSSWVFLKELIRFAQDKLDRGDYLLVDKKNEKDVFALNLANVGFSYQTKNGAYILLAHQNPSIVKD